MWRVSDWKCQGGARISGPGSCMDGHRMEEEACRETKEGLGSHPPSQAMYVRRETPGGKRVSELWARVAVRDFIKAEYWVKLADHRIHEDKIILESLENNKSNTEL